MSFQYQPAVRDKVALLIAVAGASGSGKTLSSLKIARGLAGGDDSKIAVIDTEAGRAKHYAPAPGEQAGPERFAFQHGDLKPPFSPEAYVAAIEAAEASGAEVVMIDSFSHEWEGDGGLHDIHDADLRTAVERARSSHNQSWGAFDEVRAAERANIGAWRDAKARHKRLMSRLLQCRAHLVICLRADEKVRIVKDGNRTKIVQAADLPPAERWTPICEKRFMYEMTVSLIVTPQNPGIPVPIKIQEQHRKAFPLDRRLSEDTGRLLAEWARGGQQHSNTPSAAEILPPQNGESAAPGGGPADGGSGEDAGHPEAGPSATASAPATNDDLDALMANYARYVQTTLDEEPTSTALAEWWNSDSQKKQRAAIVDGDPERKALMDRQKQKVIAAIDKAKEKGR